MKREVSNTEDILDGRDVIARRDELQEERQDLTDKLEAAHEAHAHGTHQDIVDAAEALAEWDAEYGDELKALDAFIGEGSDEWRHGETLIRESYFEDYAQQLAEDIGALENCNGWPATCIDWERAARELQQDYTSADFDGVTYYYR